MNDQSGHGKFPSRSAREQSLAETFVLLADTLVADFDVADLLHRLVTATVELVGVTAVGLLLDDQRGNLAVVAASSEETRLLEVFQLQNDEGPCLDCVRSGSAVSSESLLADKDRWPLFVPAALRAGFVSALAVPLRLREQTIGTLNLFQSSAAPTGEDEQRLAQALADVATIGLLQQRSAHRSSMLAEQLQQALNSRIAIEQAKGVLAERNTVTMDTAFEMMRSYARNTNTRLTDVAIRVVRERLDLRSPGHRPPR